MGNCTFGPGGKRADQDISQKLGDSRAILFSETFSEVCDTLHSPPPSSAKPLSLSSWGPRRLPGSSDFRRGRAEPDWGGAGAFRVTRKRPATGGSARNWLAGVSTGQWRGRAEWPHRGSSRWPCQGRRHSPTISRTLRECAPQCPRTNSTMQQASPGRCMAARVRVSGSGSAPPHGHVHGRPRPCPAHSVPEIPADSAMAT